MSARKLQNYPVVFASYWNIPLTLVEADLEGIPEAERLVARTVALAIVHASYDQGTWSSVSPKLLEGVKQHLLELKGLSPDTFDEIVQTLKDALLVEDVEFEGVTHVAPGYQLAARAVAHLKQGKPARMIAPINHLIPKKEQAS